MAAVNVQPTAVGRGAKAGDGIGERRVTGRKRNGYGGRRGGGRSWRRPHGPPSQEDGHTSEESTRQHARDCIGASTRAACGSLRKVNGDLRKRPVRNGKGPEASVDRRRVEYGMRL